MKLLLVVLCVSVSTISRASGDTLFRFFIPDSVKAISVISDVNFASSQQEGRYTLASGSSRLFLGKGKKGLVQLIFPIEAPVIAKGVNVKQKRGKLEWRLNGSTDSSYKLLLTSASDSAENFVIISGYVFIPSAQKWKLIGTYKLNNTTEAIRHTTIKYHGVELKTIFSNSWIQYSSGVWKPMNEGSTKLPSINPLPNMDSVQQYKIDRAIIKSAVSDGRVGLMQDTLGVFYSIVDPGKGKTFTVADSITVHYQLRIFGTSLVISGSETESYTFPLKNLIKAWQIAVPLVRSGGKIKLIIPSGLGYSIRTRAATIPPNSILQFDVEVLDVKPSK